MTRVDHADALVKHIALHAPDLPPYQREYRFHPVRKWRFDAAFVDHRLAIEVDGGQWVASGGRHNRDSDREKMNEAAASGWRVVRFSSQMLERDPIGCIEVLRRALRQA